MMLMNDVSIREVGIIPQYVQKHKVDYISIIITSTSFERADAGSHP